MSLLDRLRGWNRRRILALRLARLPRRTPFGFVMNGNDDMIAGRFEPAETRLMRQLIEHCDRFVNVGANSGYYCLFARQAGKPVIALEPVPQTVELLLRNLRDNGWDHGTTVLPVAAGDSPGSATIYGVGTGSSLLRGWANNPDSLAQVVPVVRLDDVVPAPAAGERLLVLMDVEGFEYPALQGSLALINAHPQPLWLIEIAPDGAGSAISAHVQATFDLMARSGYIARCANDSLAITTGPVSGVTNYIFHAATSEAEAMFGPAGLPKPVADG